jgi:hypothetical protein
MPLFYAILLARTPYDALLCVLYVTERDRCYLKTFNYEV